jgi:hypothetical protein
METDSYYTLWLRDYQTRLIQMALTIRRLGLCSSRSWHDIYDTIGVRAERLRMRKISQGRIF